MKTTLSQMRSPHRLRLEPLEARRLLAGDLGPLDPLLAVDADWTEDLSASAVEQQLLEQTSPRLRFVIIDGERFPIFDAEHDFAEPAEQLDLLPEFERPHGPPPTGLAPEGEGPGLPPPLENPDRLDPPNDSVDQRIPGPSRGNPAGPIAGPPQRPIAGNPSPNGGPLGGPELGPPPSSQTFFDWNASIPHESGSLRTVSDHETNLAGRLADSPFVEVPSLNSLLGDWNADRTEIGSQFGLSSSESEIFDTFSKVRNQQLARLEILQYLNATDDLRELSNESGAEVNKHADPDFQQDRNARVDALRQPLRTGARLMIAELAMTPLQSNATEARVDQPEAWTSSVTVYRGHEQLAARGASAVERSTDKGVASLDPSEQATTEDDFDRRFRPWISATSAAFGAIIVGIHYRRRGDEPNLPTGK